VPRWLSPPPPPSPPHTLSSPPSLPASAYFSSLLVSTSPFNRDRSSKLLLPMPARFHPATLLCLLVAVAPICSAALPDLKFPHNGTAYCSALDVCSQAGLTKGTKDWFDCITLHALRDPPALSSRVESQLSRGDADPNDPRPAAAILMDCSGVGWGNRIRAFQACVPAPPLSPLPFHVAPSVSRRPFRFTCERRCPPLSPSYQAPPWRTLISTAALPHPPPPAAKWRWRAGSRRPSAAPLGTTACTRFPSTRFEFCLFPSLGPTRRPSPRPQVPWDYAQAGFSHGPKGMWRDEFLTENAVRRYLLPTN
jgi:hypothetical protein